MLFSIKNVIDYQMVKYLAGYDSFRVYQSFTHKMAAKASWHRNYVTVALCIDRLQRNLYG